MREFMGKTKSDIKAALTKTQSEYVEFLHWLFVPRLAVVLSFDKQRCCGVGQLDEAKST